MAQKKLIGITIGDPAGIGPEIILKSLSYFTEKYTPLLIGKLSIFQQYNCLLKTGISFYSSDHLLANLTEAGIPVLEVLPDESMHIIPGTPSIDSARVAMHALRTGADLALGKKIDALVTAPIYKKGMQDAGFAFQTHTDFLAHHTKSPDCAMMLVGKGLKVVLVTVHIPFRDICAHITSETVYKTIRTTSRSLEQMGIPQPRIAVCGLNPHAGEEGMLGTEEKTILQPAIDKARRQNMHITGIFPPDTIFWQTLQGKADVVIALYHDQGLIAIKTIAFDTGVNVTIGLPFLRTSPDHGTAFTIAGKNTANISSMVHAIDFAITHAHHCVIPNE
ncbi:MAG: 4-hydroxythreonine-4-phosphate dehydrogenase PdxA [bacterium]|nr:4-hydroxythreonine-4-phosphate dehydrogenase PdxA [bacterium]